MADHPIEIALWIKALAGNAFVSVELAQLLDEALRMWAPRAKA